VKRGAVRLLAALALLVGAFPLAFILTIVLMPLWSHIEAAYAIESVGHSGPADWCFEVTYSVVVVLVGAVAIAFGRSRSQRYRRSPRNAE
jgi:hypothetical protein